MCSGEALYTDRMKTFLFILLAFAAVQHPALAQDWGNTFTPNQARDAREDGDIKPLRDIIRSLESREGGQYLNARLAGRGTDNPTYIIDWEKDGRRLVFTVDAKTGRILSRRGG